ncbi:MAG: methyltransferase domain-containing protein, partial [Nitrospinae bacterium]|nr:methyltransferase domain-containing protein [Nitrospinota bacterium]
GYCSSEDVSRYLSASDIFLLPLIDGVSSRRTTLMTALQHCVPVVSTSGFLTDDIFLKEQFILLSPSTGKNLFVANVERMADDEVLRKATGNKGRDAYNKYFLEKLMVDRYIDHALTIPKIKWCWGMKISDQLILESIYKARENIRGILLDIGCGKKPYHPLLSHKTVKWIGIDRPITHSGPPSADIFGDGKYLPFGDESFDTILCTQVIEHIDEPDIFFKEISRVLKKGGMLIMTAPQTNWLHEEPHDYYRFTKYGLIYLANKYGLSVELIKPLGGVFALLGQTISAHIPLIRKPRFAGEILRGLLQGICNFIFWYLDRFKEVPESTIGYILVAKK